VETKIDRAAEAVTELVKGSNPEDEFFLVTFADRPNLIRDFTQSAEDLQSSLLMQKPRGRTSLLDAIVMAIDNMKNARYRRRALVIISDGCDNRSRYTPGEVKSLTKEADVLVYSIGVFDSEFQTYEEQLGPELLEEISDTTGASAYTRDNPTDLPTITRHISLELRNNMYSRTLRILFGVMASGGRSRCAWRFHEALPNSTSKQEPATISRAQ
jgi:Ca-activated chloride channel homolog